MVFVLRLMLAALVMAASAAAEAAGGPDLGVSLFPTGPDPRGVLAAGQSATISVGVSNLRGDRDAPDSTLTLEVPNGLAVVQARPAANRTEPQKDATRLVWNLGNVVARAFPRLVEVELRAGSDLKPGMDLAVIASVATSDREATAAHSRAGFRFVIQEAGASLALDSTLDAVAFTVERPVGFTIEATNLGTIPAAACEITLTLPARVTFGSSTPAPTTQSGNAIMWKVGDMDPGRKRSIAVTIALDRSLRSSAYGFTGSRGSLEFALDASTSTRELDARAPHLKIVRYPEPAGSNVKVWLNARAKTPGALVAGDEVEYEILYGNYGNEPALATSVTLSLPDGLRFMAAEPAPAQSASSPKFPGGISSWDTGDLAVGRSGVIKSKVHVASVGGDDQFVEARITAAAGHDVGARDKVAYAWYGPPIQRQARAPSVPHLSLWWVGLGILVAGALAFVLVRRLRSSRERRPGEPM